MCYDNYYYVLLCCHMTIQPELSTPTSGLFVVFSESCFVSEHQLTFHVHFTIFLITFLVIKMTVVMLMMKRSISHVFLVIPLTEVLNKSMCQPREVLVDISHEYPEDTEHTFIPSCVVLNRCGGCCNDEALECIPTETRNVTLQVRPERTRIDTLLNLTDEKIVS